MGEIKYPPPAKLIVGLLTGESPLFVEVEVRLMARFGPLDLESTTFPFNFTDYYQKEMGSGLWRKYISFRDLIPKEALPGIKVFTNGLEAEYAGEKSGRGCRRINIDPGYLTAAQIVLATTKDYSHRIYLGQGVYGDPHLRYSRGGFQPFEWTYPDYRTGEALDFFLRAREVYLKALRGLVEGSGTKEYSNSRP